mgnify:CR=1 FL=1
MEYAGACYHVINRGNYRRDLFAEEGAADAFVRCVFEAGERFGWGVHAFVVMRNHFHLAVQTPKPNLSEGMRWLQATWAARFNRFRGEMGRPFQGRYRGLHVEPGHALAQVAHYIHLNPVRAGLVTAESLLEYRWSSLTWFVGANRPSCLVAGTVLRESGGLSDTSEGWRQYQGYLGLLTEEDSARREEKFSRLSRGWAIGSEEFKQELQSRVADPAGSRFELLGSDRQAHQEVQSAGWEDELRRLAQGLGVDLAALPSQRSAEEKVKLAAAMKTKTSVSNRWLAERLGMGAPDSVSQYVRRFRLHGGLQTTEFRNALSGVNP